LHQRPKRFKRFSRNEALHGSTK